MSRCYHDDVFYRVFCATLLVIALTFTVVLTNVFFDIDALLANRENVHGESRMSAEVQDSEVAYMQVKSKPATFDVVDDSIEDNGEFAYRPKRSVESEKFMFHIRNPKVKNILTNRLVNMLEELDAEKSSGNAKTESNLRIKPNFEENNANAEDNEVNLNQDSRKELKITKSKEYESNQLQLAMNDILLDDIIRHIDLNKVYKTYNSLKTKFNTKITEKETRNKNDLDEEVLGNFILKPKYKAIEENHFFKELAKFTVPHRNIMREIKEKKIFFERQTVEKVPKLTIKTIIDITSTKEDNINDTSQPVDIGGLVRIFYNGKSIGFSQMNKLTKPEHTGKMIFFDNLSETTPETFSVADFKKNKNEIEITEFAKDKRVGKYNIPKSHLNKILKDYLQNYSKFENNYFDSIEQPKPMYESKRLKRHVRIRNADKKINKRKRHTEKDGDELIVEIETHFSDKGMSQEQKKKLMQTLISKIRKAIDSETHQKTKPKSAKHTHAFKKGEKTHDEANKFKIDRSSMPRYIVTQRQLIPIGKSIAIESSNADVFDKSNEKYTQIYFGPKFVTVSKSIKSAENTDMETDYDKAIKVNNVPQRLQQPLNTESSDETQSTKTYLDFGNLKFLIQNIDGTGLSIGLNQYVDEAPDTDSLKTFSKLEDFTKHENLNDIQPDESAGYEVNNIDGNLFERKHYLKKRNAKINMSLEKNDHTSFWFTKNNGSNKYEVFDSDNLFIPFHNKKYMTMDKKGDGKLDFRYNKNYHQGNQKNGFAIDNILEKQLNSLETFSTANLSQRRKRSIFKNNLFKSQGKRIISKNLNTKLIKKKMLLRKAKRNKRQIGKIRIIATDDLPDLPRSSPNVYIDEDIFANRAPSVRDHEEPDISEVGDKEEHYDYITHSAEDNFKLRPRASFRETSLMAKYPHIFNDENPNLKDTESIPNGDFIFSKVIDNKQLRDDTQPPQKVPTISEVSYPEVPEIIKEISAQSPKNYKISVKIVPKNGTGLNSGYKEVHTSINKTYNKNGMIFHSLVNVSELMKIENSSAVKTENNHNPFNNPQLLDDAKKNQESFQKILKDHRKKIKKQINRLQKVTQQHNLNKEKKNDNKNYDEDEYVDISLSLNPPQFLHLRKGDISKLISSAMLNHHNIQDGSKANLVTTVKSDCPTFSAPNTVSTTVSTTSDPVRTSSYEPYHKKITDTIGNIENLTGNILDKIDKNTELLRVFLQKLSTRNEVSSSTIVPNKQNTERHNIDKEISMANSENIPHYWNKYYETIYHSGHGENGENLKGQQNNTHYSIPFFYAYQQPVFRKTGSPGPVANVVYHGHVHAIPKNMESNTIRTVSIKPEELKLNTEEESNNSLNHINLTKFFMDDLNNEYKIMDTLNNVKKNVALDSLAGNVTTQTH